MKSCTSNADCPVSRNCANLISHEYDPVGVALGKPFSASSNDRCADKRSEEATAAAQAMITGKAIPSSAALYPSKFCMKDPGTWFEGTRRRRSQDVDWDKVMEQVGDWGKETFKGTAKSDVLKVPP